MMEGFYLIVQLVPTLCSSKEKGAFGDGRSEPAQSNVIRLSSRNRMFVRSFNNVTRKILGDLSIKDIYTS